MENKNVSMPPPHPPALRMPPKKGRSLGQVLLLCISLTTLTNKGWAQCAAVNIPSLPVYSQAAVCHASNQITSVNIQPVCGVASTNYLGGLEALHTFTATVSGNHDITYNGQTWSSIWVYANACPTVAGSTCIGSVSSSASTQNLTVNLVAGVTYWILFDTYPSPASPCPGTFTIIPPLAPGAACGTTVYDFGGPSGNYANNANYTQVYCPGVAGEAVTLSFSQFATQANNDILYIYDGNSTAAPLLASWSGNTLPPTFNATSASGCITIRFVSNGSTVDAGWTASVTCSAPVAVPSACGTVVQDPGGPNNYANNTNITRTYCPTSPGDVVTFDVTQFATESCCDFLSVYNGPSTASPLIGTYSGNSILTPLYSTDPSGCITIRFTSDGSTTGAGWTANVTCGPPPPPIIACGSVIYDSGGAASNYANNQNLQRTYCPANPGDVVTFNFTQFATESCCDFLSIYDGPDLNSPLIGTYSGNSVLNPIYSSHPGGCLTIRFTSDGSSTAAGWAANVTCGPPPPPVIACGGSITDTGGPGGNYGNNQHYQVTYCPSTPGDVVTLTFSQFDTESCCDRLFVYNGPNINSPLIGTFSGTNSPGTVISSAPGGCITLRFVSDGSTTRPGWLANVTCGPAPDCILVLTLNDSFGDGWGSSSVGVSINGGSFQNYTLTGLSRQIVIPGSIGNTLIFNYNPSGPDQNQNEWNVAIQGQGGLFLSGSPPASGQQFVYTVDCIPLPAAQEDCIGGFTICSDQQFNNNTTSTGFVPDLNSSNTGCLQANEQQGTWYYFSPATSGTVAFTIAPSANIDYDFAVWGPMTAPSCPPNSPPSRCSWASGVNTFSLTSSYNTGLRPSGGQTSEGEFGNGWVEPLNVTAGQVYMLYIDNFDVTGQSFTLDWQLSNGATLDCAVLPFELLSLKAEPNTSAVDLLWTTGSESNASHFVVERRSGNTVFAPIGTVPAAGESVSPLDYRFTDSYPLTGVNEYRLLQVDRNGDSKRSSVVVAMFNTAESLVSPNPAAEHANLNLDRELPPNTLLRITDARGRVVKEQRISNEGTIVPLSLAGIESGLYTISLYGEKGAPLGHTRFVKE
jgi:hypothetical protein